MNALKDDSASLASFGLLIRDVKTYAEQLQCIRFSHVGKEGNSVAYNLAKHVKHVTDFSVQMENVPLYTLNVYQADLLSL